MFINKRKMNCLTQYKDIFGRPNEGFHQTRFLGMALYDTIGTIVLAYILFNYCNDTYNYPFWKILGGLFIFGEFLHVLFGVDTAFLQLFKQN